MRRYLLVLTCSILCATALAQSEPSTSGQDVPVQQAPPQAITEKQPAEAQTKIDDKSDKKPSKAKRKLRDAVPDCVNIIFSKCWHNDARQQEAEEQAAERRAQAAKRCEAIQAARARRTPPPTPASSVAPGESSSKSPEASLASPANCTPDDVIEAEHDVDVGDTYMETGNQKAAEMRYRDALKALPDDPVASLHLARLLEKQGKKAEALELYRTFMSWSPTGKEADEANKSIAKLSAGN